MSDSALKAQGTSIQIGSGSPVTYADIGEINSFNGPGGSAAVIDVSDLDSTAKEKVMGLQDNGQLSMDLNFLPADTQHALLRTAKENGTLTVFKLIFTDSGETEWAFSAYVLSLVINGAVDGVIKGSITLEISGDITES